VLQDFARVWQTADKVVYSTTLDAPSSARTRIEREFDPEAVRRLKEQSARDVGIGGPGLAAHAIRAGLVDEWQLFLTPITVGAASPLPDCARVELELIDEGRFGSEVVYVHYRTRA
jgi:riboflavin biosynthesis pyrimidine reductase